MRRFIYSPKFVSACVIGSFVPAIRLWEMYKENQVRQRSVLSPEDSNGSISKIVEISKNNRAIVLREIFYFVQNALFLRRYNHLRCYLTRQIILACLFVHLLWEYSSRSSWCLKCCHNVCPSLLLEAAETESNCAVLNLANRVAGATL